MILQVLTQKNKVKVGYIGQKAQEVQKEQMN